MKPSLIALALAFSALTTRADIKLPSFFSDNMVLQCDAAAPVWGRAEAGEEVTVTFAGQTKTTKTDATGKWLVKLDPMPASSEPRELSVASSHPKSEIINSPPFSLARSGCARASRTWR